jgi:hypothetical protein
MLMGALKVKEGGELNQKRQRNMQERDLPEWRGRQSHGLHHHLSTGFIKRLETRGLGP